MRQRGEDFIGKVWGKTLVGKPDGKKRPFGRPRHSWEVNIKKEVKEDGSEVDSSGTG
jgi:hypothetical protein